MNPVAFIWEKDLIVVVEVLFLENERNKNDAPNDHTVEGHVERDYLVDFALEWWNATLVEISGLF